MVAHSDCVLTFEIEFSPEYIAVSRNKAEVFLVIFMLMWVRMTTEFIKSKIVESANSAFVFCLLRSEGLRRKKKFS